MEICSSAGVWHLAASTDCSQRCFAVATLHCFMFAGRAQLLDKVRYSLL